MQCIIITVLIVCVRGCSQDVATGHTCAPAQPALVLRPVVDVCGDYMRTVHAVPQTPTRPPTPLPPRIHRPRKNASPAPCVMHNINERRGRMYARVTGNLRPLSRHAAHFFFSTRPSLAHVAQASGVGRSATRAPSNSCSLSFEIALHGTYTLPPLVVPRVSDSYLWAGTVISDQRTRCVRCKDKEHLQRHQH